jgi:hypothetical protein
VDAYAAAVRGGRLALGAGALVGTALAVSAVAVGLTGGPGATASSKHAARHRTVVSADHTAAGSATTVPNRPATQAAGSAPGAGPTPSTTTVSSRAGDAAVAPPSAGPSPTPTAGSSPSPGAGSGTGASGTGAPAGSDQGGTHLPDVALSLSPAVGAGAGGVPGTTTLEAAAVVTADRSDGPGLPAPSGTVTFTVGGRPACASVPLRGGRASCQVRGTTSEYVAAFYSGDAVYVGRGSYAEVG